MSPKIDCLYDVVDLAWMYHGSTCGAGLDGRDVRYTTTWMHGSLLA